MATSTYDLNVQLALATTAAHEGDVFSALEFLAEAHRLSHGADRLTRARVVLQTARLRLRSLPTLRPVFAF
jgi:hypothetical protein